MFIYLGCGGDHAGLGAHVLGGDGHVGLCRVFLLTEHAAAGDGLARLLLLSHAGAGRLLLAAVRVCLHLHLLLAHLARLQRPLLLGTNEYKL